MPDLTLEEFAERARERYGIPREIIASMKWKTPREAATRYGLDSRDPFHAVVANYRHLVELRDQHGGWDAAVRHYHGASSQPAGYQASQLRASAPNVVQTTQAPQLRASAPNVVQTTQAPQLRASAPDVTQTMRALQTPSGGDADLLRLKSAMDRAWAAYNDSYSPWERVTIAADSPFAVARDWLTGSEDPRRARMRAYALEMQKQYEQALSASTRQAQPAITGRRQPRHVARSVFEAADILNGMER